MDQTLSYTSYSADLLNLRYSISANLTHQSKINTSQTNLSILVQVLGGQLNECHKFRGKSKKLKSRIDQVIAKLKCTNLATLFRCDILYDIMGSSLFLDCSCRLNYDSYPWRNFILDREAPLSTYDGI